MSEDKEEDRSKRKLRSFSIKKGGAKRAGDAGKKAILENLDDDD
ncbi:MAG: hypothetical protein ACTSWR_00095 [Candidatus Helarchaeota archaeon]